MKKKPILLVIVILFLASVLMVPSVVGDSPTIRLVGLFPGVAVLEVDSRVRVIKLQDKGGFKSNEHQLRLVSTSSTTALVEVNGQRKELKWASEGASSYAKPRSANVVLRKNRHGHFAAQGFINRISVNLLIDKDVDAVTLSAEQAIALGIPYQKSSEWGQVISGNGIRRGFNVILESLRIAEIELQSVPAVVVEGKKPEAILLGKYFLQDIEQRETSTELELIQRH